MSRPETSPAEVMTTNQVWEYYLLHASTPDEWLEEANELGGMGWELVNSLLGGYYTGVFKRSKGPVGPG